MWIVKKFIDERMLLEHFLHDPALDASAAAVDQAHLAEAGVVRRAHVLVHDARNVLREERMKIEVVFDGNVDGILIVHVCCSTAPVVRSGR